MPPTWLPVVKAVVQPIVGALPALILVIFAGLLGLLGLACETHRRDYALAYADRFTNLAIVLIGGRHESTSNRRLTSRTNHEPSSSR
jgi:hypothetical protein